MSSGGAVYVRTTVKPPSAIAAKSSLAGPRSGKRSPSSRGRNVPYVTPRKGKRRPRALKCLPSTWTRSLALVGGTGSRGFIGAEAPPQQGPYDPSAPRRVPKDAPHYPERSQHLCLFLAITANPAGVMGPAATVLH